MREVEGGIATGVDVVGEHDTALLTPSVEQHIEQFARPPTLVATDRGFYSKQVEQRTRDELGVRQPVIPKPGYRSAERIAYERQRWFRKGRAWRSGGEARISRLKRSFGMARGGYRGSDGPQRTARWAAIQTISLPLRHVRHDGACPWAARRRRSPRREDAGIVS